MIKPITISEVEQVAHELARKLMAWDEPIPDFNSRFPNILESCLATPFSTFGKKSLYQGLAGKAAILFYLMVKNHPFENGNKRVAVMTVLIFLAKNYKWLKVSPDLLYNTAVWVAESPPDFKDQVVEAFTKLVKKHLVDIKRK